MRVSDLYQANVNGFKSKTDSIKQLVAENIVDILLLNEAIVYTSKAINIKGYQSFPVRKDRQGRDIFIDVKHGSYETVMVSQGDDADFVTVWLKIIGKVLD